MMDNITRREMVGVVARAGAITAAGLTPAAAAADDKPKSELDEK